jgi:4-alpha-glucanotransferase
LRRRGWLKRGDLARPAGGAGRRANYAAARAYRLDRLTAAFARALPGLGRHEDFQRFRAAAGAWLGDFALFGALMDRYGTKDWSAWPEELSRRVPPALAAARRELAERVLFLEFAQYLVDEQWRALRRAAAAAGVGLIGDLPIFVAHGSADVWANAGLFKLTPAGKPAVVAGCPPDAFNRDGQLWGNALYDWEALAASGFRWWIERLRSITARFDAVRLDHFIGFRRYWEIPATAKTARAGAWRDAPGDAFFQAVGRALGRPQLIAEDLGAVTPAVRALRDRFGFPGMKVLQFAFDGTEEAVEHRPHLVPEASVTYTGTHDNDTTRGWYESLRRRARGRAPGAKGARAEFANVAAYLEPTPKTVAWNMIRAGYASRAALAVTPVQDVLGLGGAHRMNVPGKAKGNWRWRLLSGEFSGAVQARLAALASAYDR